jgi:hypothetical protein
MLSVRKNQICASQSKINNFLNREILFEYLVV